MVSFFLQPLGPLPIFRRLLGDPEQPKIPVPDSGKGKQKGHSSLQLFLVMCHFQHFASLNYTVGATLQSAEEQEELQHHVYWKLIFK